MNDKQRLEHAHAFYAERFRRLRDWVRELPEAKQQEYWNIVANGTGSVHEPPTYAQMLSTSRHRTELLLEAVKPLLDQIDDTKCQGLTYGTPIALYLDVADVERLDRTRLFLQRTECLRVFTEREVQVVREGGVRWP